MVAVRRRRAQEGSDAMVTRDDITIYDDEDMLWVDATDEVDVPADAAWDAIEPLIYHLTEMGTIGGADIEVNKVDPDGPFIADGNEVIAIASALRGAIKIHMKMVFTGTQPGRYARFAITLFHQQHFADVDFTIDPIDAGRSKLRYRQGFRYHDNAFGWLAKHVSLKPREIPETAELFNFWVETATGTR